MSQIAALKTTNVAISFEDQNDNYKPYLMLYTEEGEQISDLSTIVQELYAEYEVSYF